MHIRALAMCTELPLLLQRSGFRVLKNPSSQSVTVHWTSGTYPNSLGCNLTVTGPSPSTTQVGAGSCNTATGSVSLGTLSSGTYNILIDPQKQSTGGMSLTVTAP
jgi:hypothetical protein